MRICLSRCGEGAADGARRQVNSTAALASWWSERGQRALGGPHGTFADFQPLITKKGLSLATFCETRAASSTSTTSATSL